MADEQAIPRHVGYVVDGNRRWARKHGLPVYEGHLAGYNALKEVAIATMDAGIEYMSIYIFSTENWKRDKAEIKNLMSLIFRLLTTDLGELESRNIRMRVLGSRDRLSKQMLKAIDAAEERTKNNTAGTLALCLNYGGHLEISDAVKKIVQSGIAADDITPELIEDNLYAADIPPIDMIVRSSGEQRLSNFMLWRAAYSELMFIDKTWPEMTKKDVTAIIKEYSKRSRRFGG